MFTKPNSRCLGKLAASAAALVMPVIIILVSDVPAPATHPLGPVPVVDVTSIRGVIEHLSPMNEALDLEVRQAGADESWWQAVSAQLERQEYAISPTPLGGLQAPNRAQNLRTNFGERGIEIVPRMGKDTTPAWRFTWETRSFGRPDCMQEVGSVHPETHESRVVYTHSGLVEWYENGKDGLEQGFHRARSASR